MKSSAVASQQQARNTKQKINKWGHVFIKSNWDSWPAPSGLNAPLTSPLHSIPGTSPNKTNEQRVAPQAELTKEQGEQMLRQLTFKMANYSLNCHVHVGVFLSF